ncbi:hypothetical protein [Nocardia farcinica]|uniref:hypothetical protein n=1 Tax=Nocardia farcinica TaxID=37329 RepID=UPI0015F0B51A|nr:hypothetical protein [Nocardia farcinica]MBA4858030.1 hypothetical protein [Nocardia farcinica]MBC9819439.1 hypothetical protein [Nocardia farcinica]
MSAALPVRYADGSVASADELDMIARAFGFTSARHMDEVLAGRAPSGLESWTQFARRGARRAAS